MMSIGEAISVGKLFIELLKLAFKTLLKKAPKGFLVNLVEIKSADIQGCSEKIVREKRFYKLSINPIPYDTPSFTKNFDDTIVTVQPPDEICNIMEISDNFITIEPDRTRYYKLEKEIELEFDRKSRILDLNLKKQAQNQDHQIKSPEIEFSIEPSSDPIINRKIKEICGSNPGPTLVYKIYIKNNMLIDIKRFPIKISLNLPLDKICISTFNKCIPDLQITTESSITNIIVLNQVIEIGSIDNTQDGRIKIYISEVKSNSECIIAVGIWYKE